MNGSDSTMTPTCADFYDNEVKNNSPKFGGSSDSGVEMTMAPGIMSTIEEEPHGLVSDSESTASTNSRNF